MSSKITKPVNTLLLTIMMLVLLVPFTRANASVPVTADQIPATSSSSSTTTKSSIMALSDFVTALSDGKSNVRGVYVPEVMAYRVVQQPKNQSGYVSAIQGVVTQFGMASNYGTIGLLAHNYAAGSEFARLTIDNKVSVVYGDGTVKEFIVTKIVKYQALQPNSMSSNFLDLETSEKLSASSLFSKVYGGEPHLTLQTCIAQGNESSWGRLFIIAEPVQ